MKDFFAEINRMLDRFLTPAVKTIIVINVVVTFVLTLISIQQSQALLQYAVLYLGQVPALSVLRAHIWQFVTYAFVHIDFMHLLFNMLGLWFFAPPLERRWGTRSFWSFYLITAAGAGLFHAIFTLGLHLGHPGAPVIGASGALFGVMLAFAAYYPEQPIYIWGIFPLKAKYLVGLMAFMNLMLAAQAGSGYVSNVSYLTHSTGLLVAYAWLAHHHRDWDIRRWRWTRR